MIIETLDSLTNAVTAFRTFAELTGRMDAGYVPTIRNHTRRNRMLAKILTARGYRVNVV